VSERTLADWRRKGLISYVQVSGKIWYPKEAREEFIRRNLINVEND
jgi:predicted site-specific integrase-resolvase